MASVRKPVIVRKFSRDWCAGYAGATFGQDATELEILDLNGKVLRIGWDQVKWVCYVRDFPAATQGNDQANPERLLHKRFSIRPRTAGLWLRMTLTTEKNWRVWQPMTGRWWMAPACSSPHPTRARIRSAFMCPASPFKPWRSSALLALPPAVAQTPRAETKSSPSSSPGFRVHPGGRPERIAGNLNPRVRYLPSLCSKRAFTSFLMSAAGNGLSIGN